MRRRATIAALVATAMALALVGWLGAGGSAATKPAHPSKQELAKKLLETKGVQLTPGSPRVRGPGGIRQRAGRRA